VFNGIIGVLYREMNVYKRRVKKQFLASSVSPFLFLVAFGWGFGEKVVTNGLPYITFLIPGLITMSSLNQSYSIAQEINITRFYFHLFDEYLTAPVRYIEIVLGEIMYGMFKGLLSTFLIFIYAIIFNVKLNLSFIFFIAILIHTFTFSSLGVTIAMIVRDHGSQALVNTFVITPMVFLCGTFFPIDKLPYVFKIIVYSLPLTYSIKVIRASLTGGEINSIFLILMLIFGGIFFFTANITLKRVEV